MDTGGWKRRVRAIGAPVCARVARAILAFLFASCLAAELTAQGKGALPAWWEAPRGPAYQILVYSFADSNGDGIGDFEGIIDHLDYLSDGDPSSGDDLGVQAIWLSPIHPATSYHGYDVTDYKAVSPSFGSMEDFECLVAECHKRGVKLILDMVFNHSSREHPWFKAFLSDPEGPFGAYYVRRKEGLKYGTGGMGGFNEAEGKGGMLKYFAAFWEGMPDLDCSNPAVVKEFEDILGFWIERGVDGFRFDAVKHVFDPNEVAAGSDTVSMNLAFWKGLRAFAKGEKADVFFLGEVMSDYPSQLASFSPCMDSLFDFPTAKRVLSAVASSSAETFVPAYAKALEGYSKSSGFRPAPFLSNHDQDRSMSFILSRSGLPGAAGWGPVPKDSATAGESKGKALARAKVAATILYTLPGLPFIYYGEELGMTGRSYLGDDIARRDGFPWDEARYSPPFAGWGSSTGKLEAGQNLLTPSAATQAADPTSLLAHYRALSSLMGSSPDLKGGDWAPAPWPGFSEKGMIAYLRAGGGQRLLVVHNLLAEKRSLALPEGFVFDRIFDSFADGNAARDTGAKENALTIGPLSSAVFSY